MITKKRLIIILIPLCVVFIGLAVFFNRSNDKGSSSNGQPAYISGSGKQIVGTTGLLGLNIEGTFQDVTSADVENQTYRLLSAQIKNPKEYYQGEVRQSSIVSTDETYQDVVTIGFLIDIPELKRTFKVQIEQDQNGEYSTLYVTCPEATDLKYPAVDCKDIE